MPDASEPRGRYGAFISYSRTVDARLAPALENALERFAKPWNRARSVRVFRDDADLSANAGLWTSITEALVESDVFILLASPPAAQSRWVEREIEYWRQHKDTGRLLIVPTAGEVVWDEEAGDFDWRQTTALPRALSGAFSEEPRYTDLRWARDAVELTLDHDRFRDVVADLAGAIHRRPKDEMYGEQVSQHRRTIRLARGAVTVLCVLALAATIAAVLAVRASNRAETEARISLSRQLAAQSLVAQQDRRFDLGLLLAARAYRTDPTPQARDALLSSLLAVPHLRATFQTGDAVEVAASDDRRRLAFRTAAGRVAVWDPLAGRRVGRPITLLGEPLSMALSSDGGLLAVGYPRHRVEVWNVATGLRALDLIPPGRTAGAPYDRVLNVDFGPRRRQLVWNLEFDVAVWSGRSIHRITQPFSPGEAPFEPVLSADGRRLAVGSFYAAQVAYWRLTPSGQPAGKPSLLRLRGQTAGTSHLAFSPSDPNLLAIGGKDGSVTLWNGRRARTLLKPASTSSDAVVQLSFSRNGRLLTVVDELGTAVWDVARRMRIAPELSTYPSSFGAVFLAEDRTLASIDPRGAVFVVDLDAPRWPPAPPLLAGRDLRDIDLSPDGALLATLGPARVRLWDTRTGRLRRVLPLPQGNLVTPGVRFQPDSGKLAVWDSEVEVWSADTATPDGDPTSGGKRNLVDIALRSEGVFAAVREPGRATGSYQVRVWDIKRRKYVSPPIPVGQWSPEFGPDLRFVAIPHSRGIELREVASGRMIANVSGGFAAAFSHDGALAAVSEIEGPIRILDTETGAAVGSPLDVGPNKAASQLLFRSDDSMLAAFTSARSQAGLSPLLGLQLWDVSRRTLVGGRSLVDGTQSVRGYSDLSFAESAPKLVAYGPEDGLFVWDLDPASWLHLACRLAGRSLTRHERRTYDAGANHETCG